MYRERLSSPVCRADLASRRRQPLHSGTLWASCRLRTPLPCLTSAVMMAGFLPQVTRVPPTLTWCLGAPCTSWFSRYHRGPRCTSSVQVRLSASLLLGRASHTFLIRYGPPLAQGPCERGRGVRGLRQPNQDHDRVSAQETVCPHNAPCPTQSIQTPETASTRIPHRPLLRLPWRPRQHRGDIIFGRRRILLPFSPRTIVHRDIVIPV